jgi:hypothetical protein
MNTKKSFHQLASLIFGVCIMTAFSSCSEHRVESGPRLHVDTFEELTIDGTYEVKFSPLNSSVGGVTNVKAKIQVIADQISIGLKVIDSPPMTTHSQFIHNSTECPAEIDDVNGDGFIDPMEASSVLNEVLIPLDGNLNSQEEGTAQFPISNSIGAYTYFQEGILSSLLEDLSMLGHDQELKLEGKVMVIYGIPEDTYLPGSIQNIGTTSDRAALPIACGKISRKILDESETSEPDTDV